MATINTHRLPGETPAGTSEDSSALGQPVAIDQALAHFKKRKSQERIRRLCQVVCGKLSAHECVRQGLRLRTALSPPQQAVLFRLPRARGCPTCTAGPSTAALRHLHVPHAAVHRPSSCGHAGPRCRGTPNPAKGDALHTRVAQYSQEDTNAVITVDACEHTAVTYGRRIKQDPMRKVPFQLLQRLAGPFAFTSTLQ